MPQSRQLMSLSLVVLAGCLMAGSQVAAGAPSASTATQIKQLQRQVRALSTEVTRLKRLKADSADLAEVAQGVIINSTSIQAVTPALTSLQSGLSSLQSSMTGLSTVLSGKAASSALTLKADKAALDDLAARVAALVAAHETP